MSILDINLNDVEELKILPDNDEVELRIMRAEIVPNKKDPSRNNLAIVFDVPDEPMADDIRVWLPIPTEEQKELDPKLYTKAMTRLTSFLKAFSVELPIDTEDMLTLRGWGILSETEGLDGTPQNSVRRYIIPR